MGLSVGEIVATAGLVVLVLALVRSRHWYWRPRGRRVHRGGLSLTSSTSSANPAVTVGRVFFRHVRGHRRLVGPAFVLAEVVGAAVGLALVLVLYPPGVPHDTSGRVRLPQNRGRSVISRVLTSTTPGPRRLRCRPARARRSRSTEVAHALAALGLDTSRESPKMLTRDMIASSDLAVTMGCGEEWPYVPGVRYVDWPVDDRRARTTRPCGASWPTSTPGSGSCSPSWSWTSTFPVGPQKRLTNFEHARLDEPRSRSAR